MRELRRTMLCIMVCAAIAFALCPSVSAQDAAADVPEQVMEDLGAAEEARTVRAKELSDWQMEKQRLELLKEALANEVKALDEDASATRDEIDLLREKQKQVRAARAWRDGILRALDATAEKLESALADISKAGPPTLVPPETGGPAAATDPRIRLSNAMARLRETRTALTTCDIEMISGTLNGKPRTAHVLRVGGVAAWWMALNGEDVGVVRRDESGAVFEPVAAEADAANIRRAFSMRWGREVPDWVELPVEGTE